MIFSRRNRESEVSDRFMRAPKLWALLAACWMAGTTTPVAAVNPDVPITELLHTVWQARDGLPSDSLLDVTQTTDDFIWLGTSGGLFRFDGQKFERIELPRDPKLKSASTFSLFASKDGGLWIGFTFGNVGFFKDGKLKVFDGSDGLPPGTVRFITEDLDGNIWAVTSTGVAKRESSGRWKLLPQDPAQRSSITALIFDGAGVMWAMTREGTVFRRLPGESSLTPFTPDVSRGVGRGDVTTSRDGAVWLIDGGFARQISGSPPGTPPPPRRGTFASCFDSQGSFWTLDNGVILRTRSHSSDRLFRLRSTADQYGVKEGLTYTGGFPRFLPTRDGQMWLVGSSSLQRFSDRVVARQDLKFLRPDMTGEMGLGVQRDGGLLLMPTSGVLQSLQNGKAADVPGLKDVTVIARASDQSVWAGGAGQLWHQALNGWHEVKPPAEIESRDVQAIAGKDGDDIWISVVRKGVYRLHANTWQKNGGVAGLPDEPAVTLAWDSNENLWLGYADGKIARVNGSEMQMFGVSEGADMGVVTALVAHGKDIWAGGEFGLRHWNGRTFTRLRSLRERAFDQVTGIVAGKSGDLWLNSAAGMIRITASDVGRALASPDAPVAVDVFDQLDGYTGSSARVRPLPTAIEANDGKLWFVSTAGVFSIDPSVTALHREAPRPVINSLIANGKRYEPNSPILLPKGTRALQFDFVAVDLQVPQRVRYRYKLDKVDPDWQDVGPQRQAFYTNLGPGEYKFHVIASADSRVWSETETVQNFRISPTFVQTRWFYALCLMTAIVGVALLFRWRLRQIAQRLRWKLEAQLAERDRIARELHDTLLQSTQGLILSFQAISNRMPDGDVNREKMEKALEHADEVLIEGRDRVRGLRRTSGGHTNLNDALRAHGEELAIDASSAFHFEAKGTEPTLPPDVADEIQRIMSEALLNAFRHSAAKNIRLRIVNDSRQLTVMVEDDGSSIDPAIVQADGRAGHWGLRGMRERTERISGRLTVGPRAEGGTSVELVVPIKRAGGRR
jgi:signal transduction histidine kinase/ligand-binding sensor domain-containing protein